MILGLSSSEIFFFIDANENINFGFFKPIEKKEKHCPFESLKIVDEFFFPVDLQNETIGRIVNDQKN